MNYKFSFLIILLSICFCKSLMSDNISATKNQLKQTKDLIKRKLNEKKTFIAKEITLTNELKEIENKLRVIEDERKVINLKIRRIENKLSSLNRDLEILNSNIDFYNRYLEYEMNRYSKDFVICNHLYKDMLSQKIRKIEMIENYNQLKDISYKKENIQNIVEIIEKEKMDLENLKNLQIKKKAEQNNLFLKKNSILVKLKEKRLKLQDEIEQLERTQNSLSEIIKKYETQKAKALSLRKDTTDKLKPPIINRKFIMPLSGKIICKFGKETVNSDNVCIIRNGVNIQGLSNVELVAIEKGKVLFVSNNFRVFGKMVIIEHDNDIYSVYGQLGEILVLEGQNVEKQQPIAKTDSTGQIYFELRKNLIPVDPELYFEN